jgi:hypothetical protein
VTRARVGPPVRVRIFPAWWSPKVWPLLLVFAGTAGIVAWARTSEITPSSGTLWPYFLVMAAGLAWRFRSPVVVLDPGGIAFEARSAEDDSEMGIVWSRRSRGAQPGVWTVLAASSIADWRREGMGIRLTLAGDLRRSTALSLAGISERDRKRIVDWLTEKVGG